MGAVFLAILILTMREFLTLTRLPKSVESWLYMITVILYGLVFLIAGQYLCPSAAWGILPLMFIGIVWHLYTHEEDAFRGMALTVFAAVYIIIPFSLIPVVVMFSGDYNPLFLIALLLIIWGMDTGGYFAGVAFGRHRLFERISPKKSWEGLVGGMILSLVAISVFHHYLGLLQLWQWFITTLVVGLAGTLGDLVESLIKRETNIKDSGNTLPGHGGFMDRFDSLLFGVPFYLYLLYLFLP
jgi:phosphatidate cytidylyltransferase